MSKDLAQGKIKCNLSTLLGAHKMKISELAKVAGIAYKTAHSLYHETSSAISFEVLASICEVLECDTGDILEYRRD